MTVADRNNADLSIITPKARWKETDFFQSSLEDGNDILFVQASLTIKSNFWTLVSDNVPVQPIVGKHSSQPQDQHHSSTRLCFRSFSRRLYIRIFSSTYKRKCPLCIWTSFHLSDHLVYFQKSNKTSISIVKNLIYIYPTTPNISIGCLSVK